MALHGIGLALALLALPAAAEPQAEAERFVMETHAVILPGLEQPQPATFMLNTINGDTWRVTDGHVWRYRAEAVSDDSDPGIRESFERLPERDFAPD